ncbi:MAG: hypothetical protein P9L98_03335 [Candidatus Kaelpia imicola]|nr:hypothetical protein [Candidatus Kaelpia imicola]
MNLDRLKDKQYLKLFAVIGTILLLYIVVQPFIVRWSGLNTAVKINEGKFHKTLKLISEKDKINSVYKSIAAEVTLDKLIAGDDEEVRISVYKELNRLANYCRVKLRSVTPKTTILNKENEQALYFEINVEAGLEGILKFLYHIESPFSLMSAEKIKVNPGSNNKLMLQIKLKRILI